MKRALINLYNWAMDIWDELQFIFMLLLSALYFLACLPWHGLKLITAKIAGSKPKLTSEPKQTEKKPAHPAHHDRAGRTDDAPKQQKEKTDAHHYIAQIQTAVPVHIKEYTENGRPKYTLISRAHNSLPVHLEYFEEQDVLTMEIVGADCAYWRTGERKPLAMYIPAGIAALQGRWTKRFGLHGWDICFLQPDGRWLITRVAGDYRVHYTSLRRWVLPPARGRY